MIKLCNKNVFKLLNPFLNYLYNDIVWESKYRVDSVFSCVLLSGTLVEEKINFLMEFFPASSPDTHGLG